MIMKRCAFAVLAFVLTAGLFASKSIAEEKVYLRVRLEPGQEYDMGMTTNQKISQTVMGQQQNTNQTTVVGFGAEVLAVDANGITSVSVTIKTLQVKISGPMGLIEYDSTKPDTPADNPMVQMMKKMYAGMVGQSLVMQIAPNGKVVGVEGIEEVKQRVLEAMGGEDEMTKKMVESSLTEDNMKMTMGNITMVYPTEPAGIGDSWLDKDKLKVAFGIPIEMENTYTLKSREDGVAVVEVQSEMEMGDANEPIEMGSVKIHMEMTGSQQGSIEIDEASGMVIRGKVNSRLSGQMKMPSNEQMPQGMTIPMLIEGTVTIEPLEQATNKVD